MRTRKARVRYWELGPGLDYRSEDHTSRAPVDMLRYDVAFVSDKFVNLFLTIRTSDYTGEATEGRWKSFGIKYIKELKGDAIRHLPAVDKDTWYTMQHPKDSYERYEKITLRQYCARHGYELTNLVQ